MPLVEELMINLMFAQRGWVRAAGEDLFEGEGRRRKPG